MQKLLRLAGKVPAGIMLIPLFLGALLHTFMPQVLEIGSFTTAVFSGSAAPTLMGVQLLCMGTRLRVQSVPRVFAKGALLLTTRLACGALVVVIFRLLGVDAIGGVCVLAVVCAISNTNGSIYLSLCNMLGDVEGAAGTPILALNNGPMFPLILLGAAGYMTMNWVDVVAMLLPMALGMVLGSLSQEIADFLDGGVPLLLPFIGFTLGAGIDLAVAVSAGLCGLALAGFALVVGGIALVLVDKILCKGSGAVGLSAGATGANAVAVPAILAMSDPQWQPFVAQATAQIATCAVVSAIVIPIAVAKIGKTNHTA